MDDSWIDKLAIQELCSRYCQAIDAQDAEGWARCFVPDGAFEFDGRIVAVNGRCVCSPRLTRCLCAGAI